MRIARKRLPAVIPLASTADVAFLLLIFFIVLAKGTNEATQEVRPAVTTARLNTADPAMATVTIDRSSKVYLNGSPISAPGVKDAVNNFLGDAPPGRRKVLLRIDKGVPEKVFGQVMLDVSDTGADIWRALDEPEVK